MIKFDISSLDFKKMNGLIPTIVKDENGSILMLAYSNKESLRKTIKTSRGCYFSRERKKLWVKGETSGNTQRVKKILSDCDNDSLIFIVKQKGNACHFNRYSCFKEENKFELEDLYKTIKKRAKSRSKNSYSYKLLKNPQLLKEKLLEEAGELVRTRNKKQVIWEAADLLYFITVFLAKRNVKFSDVKKKLEDRNSNKKKLLKERKKKEARKEKK